jgi:hypothetical protein
MRVKVVAAGRLHKLPKMGKTTGQEQNLTCQKIQRFHLTEVGHHDGPR